MRNRSSPETGGMNLGASRSVFVQLMHIIVQQL
jgi:hypothetical protein